MAGEDREEYLAAALLERLASGEAGAPAGAAPSSDLAELEEACALLAFSLPPAAPRPELKERLFAALPARLAEAPALPPAAVPVAPIGPVVSFADFARRERRSRQLMMALAAALAVCLIGVAYLYGRVSEQSGRLAAQADLAGQIERQGAELATLTRRLHMVTSVARFAYRMQSVATTPAVAASPDHPPQGIVYVCGHHQQWILSLEHLAPPPPGYEYHLHFRSAEGEVDGGVLRVGADARAGMEDVKLPPGTRGFSVTLEKVGEPADPLLVLQSTPGVQL